MGIDCPLVPLRTLVYRADVGGGIIEHEYVHLFTGCWRGLVLPDPEETDAHAWRSLVAVQMDAAGHPERFTAWFRLYLAKGPEEFLKRC